MIGVSQTLSDSARAGWSKFRIAEALGAGEHDVHLAFVDPPVRVIVFGVDHDSLDRPTAVLEAYHPEIDGISWEDIWNAVRRRCPKSNPIHQGTDSEYESIKASIAKFGSLQPVVVDETGAIIAGRLRKRACDELGVNCSTEVVAGLTPDQQEELSFDLDYCRKQLTLNDKRNTAELILKANPRIADREIGRASGLDHKTIGTIRSDLEERGEIPHVAQRQGGDGKAYKFRRIATKSKQEEQRACDSLQYLGEDAPNKPLDLKRVERLVREKQAREQKAKRTNIPLLLDDSIQILHSDFRNLTIDDNSVPLILADPPYDRDSIPLYEDVARFAAEKLRPDGFLVAYTGLTHFPQTIAAISAHLKWVWKIVVVYSNESRYIHGRNVLNKHRDVLVFSKGRTDLPVAISDVIMGGGKEKDFHEWQQSISEEVILIDCLTKPGDLVVSPFGGGFTTAVACHRLGRRCLTCDIDADAVQIGLERLEQERNH